ncbi:cupin domain-containing protein [Halopenitus sp. POP-27]|uniref:cupin domain-containing protein n=1 Tax=Halopenitus sp. POP-27 TaxID=2994425 RepID=UPI0024690C1C|nr:cupin domain-containing protein [Halopenitus sp. POP-27]
MGYRIVDPDAIDPTPDRPCEQRALTEPAELEHVAMNRYRADPGESIPLRYHFHEKQEEAFYVLAGELAVETPEKTYTVPSGSLFVVEPGDPQRAYNPADAAESIEILAIGAPQTTGDARQYDPNEPDDDAGAE